MEITVPNGGRRVTMNADRMKIGGINSDEGDDNSRLSAADYDESDTTCARAFDGVRIDKTISNHGHRRTNSLKNEHGDYGDDDSPRGDGKTNNRICDKVGRGVGYPELKSKNCDKKSNGEYTMNKLNGGRNTHRERACVYSSTSINSSGEKRKRTRNRSSPKYTLTPHASARSFDGIRIDKVINQFGDDNDEKIANRVENRSTSYREEEASRSQGRNSKSRGKNHGQSSPWDTMDNSAALQGMQSMGIQRCEDDRTGEGKCSFTYLPSINPDITYSSLFLFNISQFSQEKEEDRSVWHKLTLEEI